MTPFVYDSLNDTFIYMVYSHWLCPGPGQRLGSLPGRMGGMVLRRTIHIAPEQRQGPEQGQGRMGYIPIFQVLKLFQVVCFNDISMADTANVNGFCIMSVQVPVPVPISETVSVNTPLVKATHIFVVPLVNFLVSSTFLHCEITFHYSHTLQNKKVEVCGRFYFCYFYTDMKLLLVPSVFQFVC